VTAVSTVSGSAGSSLHDDEPGDRSAKEEHHAGHDRDELREGLDIGGRSGLDEPDALADIADHVHLVEALAGVADLIHHQPEFGFDLGVALEILGDLVDLSARDLGLFEQAHLGRFGCLDRLTVLLHKVLQRFFHLAIDDFLVPIFERLELCLGSFHGP